MRRRQILGVAIAVTLAGCMAQAAGPKEAQVRAELNAIGDAYHRCVTTLGENSTQCQTMANGIDQVASGLDSAQSTGAMIQMENAGRRSMGR